MTDEKNSDCRNYMIGLSHSIVGPVMYEYVKWIIYNAVQRKIKRLYFLARDGYLLREIAFKVCKRYGFDIECRYLYCSRTALRMPTYHLIGDEMYDLLLLKGYYITPLSVLKRGGLNDNECDAVLSLMEISERDRQLSDAEFEEFAAKLRKCKLFGELVIQKSKSAYPEAIGYMTQEGLLNGENIAVVDSGWTGSMQRSLRQLLQSCGFDGKITGFYFGMYAAPKSPDDGEYLTYYFDSNSGAKRKVMFNNNLFECMLSAKHGMTVGYEKVNDRYVPVTIDKHPSEMLELISAQIQGALEYTDDRLAKEAEFFFSEKRSGRLCYRLLSRIMTKPAPKEAEMYGKFLFCDDITEEYKLVLVDGNSRSQLRNYMFFTRLWSKFFSKNKKPDTKMLWVYGVIAGCPAPMRGWYRVNAKMWAWIKYILKK